MHAIEEVDQAVVETSERRGPMILRWALALVFIWFGALKFGPGQSPAEDLAGCTMERMTRGRLRGPAALRLLAVIECSVGLGMLSRRMLRPTLALMAFHLLGASSPLVMFPKRCFRRPWVPTLEGQYIVKNVVLAAAGFVLASNVRGRPPRPRA